MKKIALIALGYLIASFAYNRIVGNRFGFFAPLDLIGTAVDRLRGSGIGRGRISGPGDPTRRLPDFRAASPIAGPGDPARG